MLFFFIQCVLSLTLLLSFGRSHYLCSRESESLRYAAEHCHLNDGTLLTSDELGGITLSELTKAGVTEFWTSNVIEVAHAVEYIGCYIYSRGVAQYDPITAGWRINLVGCQSACTNNYNINPSYGLYDDKCICLYGHVDFVPSKQSCFLNCSFDTLEFCTDSKLIALYRRIIDDGTTFQIPKFATNKCVTQVNSTTNSTENCQKYLPYQCSKQYNSLKCDKPDGKINNGTFLNAIDKCGDRYNKTIDSLDYSWKPVFFPTINRIKNQFIGDENYLKMMICKSFKIDGSHTYLKERNCTDLLPYVCKTDDINATSTQFKPCHIRNKPTTSQTDGIRNSVTLTTLDTTSTTIVQSGPRNSFKLSPTNTTYTLIENTTFNTPIYCHADCRPECTYKWNTSTSSYPLIFGKVDRSQAGIYVCTATNPLGSSEVSITVIVQYGPRNSVKLSPTNTTYTLIENTTFNTPIYCHADCRPECTYKWNTSTSSYPLIFGKVDRSQAGTYVCTATNPIGSSEVSITVIVKCAPRALSGKTVRVYVTIGQKLKINTSFVAYPLPDITWFCNGNLIEDNLINSIQTLEYKVISFLCINSTTVNDLGIYTVVAENAFGKTVVSFIVQERPKATELSLDRGVIVGSVFAGLVFVVIVTLLTIFLYRRKRTQNPKINKQTFSSPESREQCRNESKYEDLQTRSETNDYDIPGTEDQYENNANSTVSNGPVQYEPLHDRTNISTYEELELNDKKSLTEKPLYANTVAK